MASSTKLQNDVTSLVLAWEKQLEENTMLLQTDFSETLKVNEVTDYIKLDHCYTLSLTSSNRLDCHHLSHHDAKSSCYYSSLCLEGQKTRFHNPLDDDNCVLHSSCPPTLLNEIHTDSNDPDICTDVQCMIREQIITMDDFELFIGDDVSMEQTLDYGDPETPEQSNRPVVKCQVSRSATLEQCSEFKSNQDTEQSQTNAMLLAEKKDPSLSEATSFCGGVITSSWANKIRDNADLLGLSRDEETVAPSCDLEHDLIAHHARSIVCELAERCVPENVMISESCQFRNDEIKVSGSGDCFMAPEPAKIKLNHTTRVASDVENKCAADTVMSILAEIIENLPVMVNAVSEQMTVSNIEVDVNGTSFVFDELLADGNLRRSKGMDLHDCKEQGLHRFEDQDVYEPEKQNLSRCEDLDLNTIGVDQTLGSEEQNTNSSEQHNSNMSEEQEFNISKGQEVNRSEEHEVNRPEKQDLNISEEEDINVSEEEEVNKSQEQEVNRPGEQEVNISSEVSELRRTEKQKANICEDQELNRSEEQEINTKEQELKQSEEQEVNRSEVQENNKYEEQEVNRPEKQKHPNRPVEQEVNRYKEQEFNRSEEQEVDRPEEQEVNRSEELEFNWPEEQELNRPGDREFINMSGEQEVKVSEEQEQEVNRPEKPEIIVLEVHEINRSDEQEGNNRHEEQEFNRPEEQGANISQKQEQEREVNISEEQNVPRLKEQVVNISEEQDVPRLEGQVVNLSEGQDVPRLKEHLVNIFKEQDVPRLEGQVVNISEEQDVPRLEEQVVNTSEEPDVPRLEKQVVNISEENDVTRLEKQVFNISEEQDVPRLEEQVVTISKEKDVTRLEKQVVNISEEQEQEVIRPEKLELNRPEEHEINRPEEPELTNVEEQILSRSDGQCINQFEEQDLNRCKEKDLGRSAPSTVKRLAEDHRDSQVPCKRAKYEHLSPIPVCYQTGSQSPTHTEGSPLMDKKDQAVPTLENVSMLDEMTGCSPDESLYLLEQQQQLKVRDCDVEDERSLSQESLEEDKDKLPQGNQNCESAARKNLLPQQQQQQQHQRAFSHWNYYPCLPSQTAKPQVIDADSMPDGAQPDEDDRLQTGLGLSGSQKPLRLGLSRRQRVTSLHPQLYQ